MCVLACVWIAGNAAAQSVATPETKSSGMSDCPMHAAHMADAAKSEADTHEAMMRRGADGMGFSQTATTHHFLLSAEGGAIQVEVNDAADTADLANVRMHLGHIAKAFAGRDFDIPMFVHDTVPPGVPTMKRLAQKIRYTYEETPKGGRVVIASDDPEARAAVHEFLKFQIEEHRTGDPVELH
jgi:hypothetical protein